MHKARRLLARGTLAITLVFAGLVIVGSRPAAAANNGVWSVQPVGADGVTPRDWFEYQLRPGQTLKDLVSISNQSDDPLELALYPADAYNTRIDAALAFRQRADKSSDAGAWVHFDVSNLVVPPKSRLQVAFEITVPADASPGDHVAGILAEDISPAAAPAQSGKGINIRRRVGARVYVRVVGPLMPALQVTRIGIKRTNPLLPPFTGRASAAAVLEITNVGNTRLTGTATVRVDGLFGRTIRRFDTVQLPELTPRGSVIVTEAWGHLPALDRVSVSATVEAPGTRTKRSTVFWIVPWVYVSTGVLLAGALFVRWRRRRARPMTPPRPVPDRELQPA